MPRSSENSSPVGLLSRVSLEYGYVRVVHFLQTSDHVDVPGTVNRYMLADWSAPCRVEPNPTREQLLAQFPILPVLPTALRFPDDESRPVEPQWPKCPTNLVRRQPQDFVGPYQGIRHDIVERSQPRPPPAASVETVGVVPNPTFRVIVFRLCHSVVPPLPNDPAHRRPSEL